MCLLPDGEFLGIVSANSFSASPSLSSASGTDDRNVRPFVLVPQTPQGPFVLFHVCCPDWVTHIVLLSSLLVLPSVFSVLLLSKPFEPLISVTVSPGAFPVAEKMPLRVNSRCIVFLVWGLLIISVLLLVEISLVLDVVSDFV